MDRCIRPKPDEGEYLEKCSIATTQIKRMDIVGLILYLVITLIVVVCMPFYEEIFVSGIFLAIGHILFFIGVPVFVYKIRRTKITKTSIATLLSTYSVGFIAFPLHMLLPNLFPRYTIIYLPTISSLLLVVSSIFLILRKNSSGRVLMIKFLCLLVILLTLLAPTSLGLALPHIYAPPALIPNNLMVYNECIKFLKNHDEHKNIGLWRGLLCIDDDMYSPSMYLQIKGTKESFSENDIYEIKELIKQLFSIRCIGLQRHDEMVLFYKNANYILPSRHGVLYSLNGESPNEADIKNLDDAKPFIKIIGNWYISRKLCLRGPRVDVQASIPKALIDHSLRIDGIDPNDLTRFD